MFSHLFYKLILFIPETFHKKVVKKLVPFLGRVEPVCFRVGDIHTKGFPHSSVGKESAFRRPWFNSWVGKICCRRDRQPTPVFLGFSCGSASKESTCYVGDLGVIPWLGRSPGEGKGYPFQYSGLENSMDCIVHGVAKGGTKLSTFHFTFTPLGYTFVVISPRSSSKSCKQGFAFIQVLIGRTCLWLI